MGCPRYISTKLTDNDLESGMKETKAGRRQAFKKNSGRQAAASVCAEVCRNVSLKTACHLRLRPVINKTAQAKWLFFYFSLPLVHFTTFVFLLKKIRGMGEADFNFLSVRYLYQYHGIWVCRCVSGSFYL